MPRRAGILVPLFSIPSSRSWGIGEIGDISVFARWLRASGQRLLQLLPINEMPPGQTSPYSALSAMAIDPQFITVGDLEDFDALGGESRLDVALCARLDGARTAQAVDYPAVRELKQIVLRRAFAANGVAIAAALAKHVPAGVEEVLDEPYGDAPGERLDVYRPPGAEPSPTVVWIHGGGFIGGTLEQDESLNRAFALELGIAAAFRGSPDVTVFVLPGAGHNHNVAPNRTVLWNRIAWWALTP